MTSTFVKTMCQHCSGHIEFDAAQLERPEILIECPHCHSHTMIGVPRPPPIPPLPVLKRPSTPFPFRSLAKWVVIGWTALCAVGVGYGFLNVIWSEVRHPVLGSSNQFESAGAAIGFGMGLFFWFVIWGIVAIPAGLIWLITKKDA